MVEKRINIWFFEDSKFYHKEKFGHNLVIQKHLFLNGKVKRLLDV